VLEPTFFGKIAPTFVFVATYVIKPLVFINVFFRRFTAKGAHHLAKNIIFSNSSKVPGGARRIIYLYPLKTPEPLRKILHPILQGLATICMNYDCFAAFRYVRLRITECENEVNALSCIVCISAVLLFTSSDTTRVIRIAQECRQTLLSRGYSQMTSRCDWSNRPAAHCRVACRCYNSSQIKPVAHPQAKADITAIDPYKNQFSAAFRWAANCNRIW